ncbi:MAG: thioredoxin family protein [Bacteroidetes bacterium]|nr:thioredoxin family protein [Bacteroidota bacterium]
MHETISSFGDFNNTKSNSLAVLFYFSHDDCNVCKILKPKIYELLQNEFPKIKFRYVDIKKTPEVSAQNNIFTVPTLLIYFEGKEFVRRSRNIGITELKNLIERPYKMMF